MSNHAFCSDGLVVWDWEGCTGWLLIDREINGGAICRPVLIRALQEKISCYVPSCLVSFFNVDDDGPELPTSRSTYPISNKGRKGR